MKIAGPLMAGTLRRAGGRGLDEWEASVERDDPGPVDPVHLGVLEAAHDVPAERMGVAVEEVPGAMLAHPGEQAVEADVGGIVGVVVDPAWRAVGQENVGAGQLAGELGRLTLRVVERTA